MKLINRIMQTGLLYALSVMVSYSIAVPIVSISPETSLVAVGDTVEVDVLWDGTDGSYIGDWDIFISYDDSIVTYVPASAIPGTVIDPLGGVDSFYAGTGCTPDGIDCDDLSVLGTIDLFQVSFDAILDPSLLTVNQGLLGNVFPLATLRFEAIASGVTPLSFVGVNTFGDEEGFAIEPTLVDGRICVFEPGAARECPPEEVPEPSTLYTLLLGLAGMVVVRRRVKGKVF